MPFEFEFKFDANLIKNDGVFPTFEGAMKKTSMAMRMCSYVFNFDKEGSPDEIIKKEEEDFDDDFGELLVDMGINEENKKVPELTNI